MTYHCQTPFLLPDNLWKVCSLKNCALESPKRSQGPGGAAPGTGSGIRELEQIRWHSLMVPGICTKDNRIGRYVQLSDASDIIISAIVLFCVLVWSMFIPPGATFSGHRLLGWPTSCWIHVFLGFHRTFIGLFTIFHPSGPSQLPGFGMWSLLVVLA